MRTLIGCLLACVVVACGCCASHHDENAAATPHRPAPTTQPSRPQARSSPAPAGHLILASAANDDTAAATSQPTTRPDSPPLLEVKSARYGSGDNWVDVTGQCRKLVNHGILVLPKDLHTIFEVDPDPGYMKYVDLVLIINGAEVKMTVADNLQLMPLRLVPKRPAAAATEPTTAATQPP